MKTNKWKVAENLVTETVTVDTGRLLIIDPAYIELLPDDVGSPNPLKQLELGQGGKGAVVSTGFGDGTYTITATTFIDSENCNNITVKRVVIDFC